MEISRAKFFGGKNISNFGWYNKIAYCSLLTHTQTTMNTVEWQLENDRRDDSNKTPTDGSALSETVCSRGGKYKIEMEKF